MIMKLNPSLVELFEQKTPATRAGNLNGRLSLNVLVADDEEAIGNFLSKVLSGAGCRVETTLDGWAAWDALREEAFDLLITDHRMPGVTGVELIERLRFTHPDLPVILMSGDMDEVMALHPSLDGIVLLTKPFDVDRLLQTVQEALWSLSDDENDGERLPRRHDDAGRTDRYHHWGLNE